MSVRSGIQRAVAEFGGSPSALASAVGGKVLRQNVEYWLKIGKVPPEHVPAVHRSTGGRIPYEDLNPDVDWAYVASTAERAA